MPQQVAYASTVKWLAYGGAAGGGKTDLLIGKFLTRHTTSIVFRRDGGQVRDLRSRAVEIVGGDNGLNKVEGTFAFAPGKTLQFAGLQYEDDKFKHKGRARDGIGFDEATEFTRTQVQYITTWNRTTVAGQSCQVVMTFNPPDNLEGEWVIEFFAPWLDEDFSGPGGRAASGEVRHAYVKQTPDGRFIDVWTSGPGTFEDDGQTYTAESRCFIAARVEDNPFLMATGYDKTLDALPDELREKMRFGIIRRNLKDNPLQVVPREWMILAQQRWEEFHASGEVLEVPLSATGGDVSRGGSDKTAICNRYGTYFAEVVTHQGVDTDDGPKTAGLILAENDGIAPINVDAVGVGTSTYDSLKDNHPKVNPINGAAKSGHADPRDPKKWVYAFDKSGKFKLANKRVELHWRMREALDPQHGDGLMLPPGGHIVKQASAARYKVTPSGLRVELKEDLIKRLGHSPDEWEAILYAFEDGDPSMVRPNAQNNLTAASAVAAALRRRNP